MPLFLNQEVTCWPRLPLFLCFVFSCYPHTPFQGEWSIGYLPVYFLMALIKVSPYFLILNSPIPLMRPNAWRVVGFIFVNSCRLLSDNTMYGG